ncbi:hypothetical protein [Rhizobium indigoferae]|uniref:HEPN domain-containing protein n=1 Tax=Rhizobium indigoferae TaxID=158891 RepID=A0ABZ0Z6R3_9HYPH|nr:hypothetical protein [Rhizobium indigoferae]NNU57218.1 hypothetical protein [Rhizobium indigoferae]WQN35144.1 hypothetical protein U5G49_000167 [Rhizobium indigoferae]GLR60279.1 hypothetical protein GCM10007919_50070 [Rhizobium indigoferae]
MRTEEQVLALPAGMERETRAAEAAVSTLSFDRADQLKQAAVLHLVANAFLAYSQICDRKTGSDTSEHSAITAELALGAIDIVMGLIKSERDDEFVIFERLATEGSTKEDEVIAALDAWRDDLRGAMNVLAGLKQQQDSEFRYLQDLHMRPTGNKNDQPHARDLLWRLFECFCDATGSSLSMGFSPSTKTPFFAFYNFTAAGICAYEGKDLETFHDIKYFAGKMTDIRKAKS